MREVIFYTHEMQKCRMKIINNQIHIITYILRSDPFDALRRAVLLSYDVHRTGMYVFSRFTLYHMAYGR